MGNHIDKFNTIKSEWYTFKSKPENKKTRIRNAADALDTTEANLLSTDIGENVFFLKINDYESLLKEILQIDKLMFLIRTDDVVHEIIIDTSKVNVKDDSIFYKNQKSTIVKFNLDIFEYVFFENKKHGNKDLKSFQIFDKNGDSILKIYLKGSKSNQFDRIALKYKCDYKYEIQKNSYNKINYDTKNKLSQSYLLNKNILRQILEKASEKEFPISINAFGNQISQYYNGKIKNIIDFGPWINIIDKSFNLHVLEKNVTRNIIKYDKTTELFIVHLFDSNDSQILEIKLSKDYEQYFKSIVKN